jgi:HEAT repeat protein
VLQQVIQALVVSRNEAADDVLLEALRLGNAAEKSAVLAALIERKTTRGLSGVIGEFDALPEGLKLTILDQIRAFYAALRESGRSDDLKRRMSALKLIALGRQGKLAYILSENIHDNDQAVAKAAADALVGLARWVSSETRALQRGMSAADEAAQAHQIHHELNDNRGEIEQTVARALDVHRGRFGPELLRAALLLCDWPGSRTLAILQTAKHAGQSPMVRRLQQPPASEHVEAFLLGASHGGLRSHFGVVVSHIDEAPVLDALLRKTHWLKDHQLQLCMRQVMRGTWWDEAELARDIERRQPADAVRIGAWLGASGMHDVVQDERLEKLLLHGGDEPACRLALLRVAMERPRGASLRFCKAMLNDPDERLMRMAAREIVRRRPADMDNLLLPLMTNAPQSVRQVVSRAIGQAGFEHFWQRFDRLDKVTRRSAGKAMMKILPDAVLRLGRKLATGPAQHRLKAMQIVHELDLAETLRPVLVQMCRDANPKLRSKAIHVLGEDPAAPAEVLLDRLINDSDARVRANAIEVLESKQKAEYVPILAQKARASNNRERANAIKALHRMKVGTASSQLLLMLQDGRPEHRISALWALRKIGWWRMLNEVGRLAKEDDNLRVRRYALGVLRSVAEVFNNERAGKEQAQAV